MNDTLVVAIGGVVAGTVSRAGRALRFVYDEDYRHQPGATPLSTSMPLQVRTFAGGIVSTWLAGLLPDSAEVLSRWARQFQVPASSPFSLLGTPIGEDCAGAVQVIRPERVEQVLSRPARIEWLDEGQVAKRLAVLRRDATAWLGADFTGRFSLTGAQAKTALHFDGRRWGIPSGAAPTTHILKPAIVGLDDHDLNEHLCLDAAHRAGLLVVRTHIARFADQTAVAVVRYDRIRRGRRVVRIHQEDLCQALGVAPARKYQADGGPGVADIARLLRDVVRPPSTATALESFLDALAWNWVIGGTDAHAKNYSLLLSGEQVRLAPLYDIASVLPYPGVDEQKLKTAMKLGGEYRLKAHNGRTWAKVASELGLDADRAIGRVADVVAAAPDALRDAAATPEVRRLRSRLPGALVDAVAARAQRCARLVGTSG